MSKKMQKESARSRSSRATAGPAASKGKSKSTSKSSTRVISKGKPAMLTEGDQAPSFSLPQAGGGTVSLADFAGRNLVLFFYPRAGTPGCTIEASDFSRLAEKFTAADTSLLGVSADPVKAIETFHKKNLLKIPLATDEVHSTLKAFGVWDKKSMYGKVFDGVVRSTFLVGKTGRILKIWRKVKVSGHADDVLSTVIGTAKAAATHPSVS